MFFGLVIVVSFAEGAARRTAKLKELQVGPVSGKNHETRAREPFRSCRKDKGKTDRALSGFERISSRHRSEVVFPLSRMKTWINSRDVRYKAF